MSLPIKLTLSSGWTVHFDTTDKFVFEAPSGKNRTELKLSLADTEVLVAFIKVSLVAAHYPK